MSEEIYITCSKNRDWLSRNQSEKDRMNQEIITLIEIATSDDFTREYPTSMCDIVAVVDTSGSMNEPFVEGEQITRREATIKALQHIAGPLGQADTLSMVCYDSDAYKELERVPGPEKSRIISSIKEGIERHNGATNFEKAFELTQRLINNCKNPSQKVIFLTDGKPNQGNLDRAKQINAQLAQKGVTVDCLGFGGSEFNFSLMQEFTSAANGATKSLKTTEQAKGIFDTLLKGSQVSLISNVVLRLKLEAFCRDMEIYQMTPEVRYFDAQRFFTSTPSGHLVTIPVVAMMQTHIYRYIVRLKMDIPGDPSQSFQPFMTVQLDYDIPVKNLKGQSMESVIGLNLTDETSGEQVDIDVIRGYKEATLAKLDKAVQLAAGQKQWDEVNRIFLQMQKIADEIKDTAKVQEYDNKRQNLVRQGYLTQDQLNQVSEGTTSSKSYGTGEKPPSLSEI